MATEAWILAALLQFAPPERVPQFPGHEETLAQTEARYASIAGDIAAAVETDTRPGMSARDKAAVLISVAIGESRLSRDADLGPCFRGKRGGKLWSRCDSGRAATIWQLQTALWQGETLRPADLFKDRRRAASVALAAIRSSLWRCRRLAAVDSLSGLGGGCQKGHEGAQGHYKRWMRVRSWSPTAHTDR